MSENRLLKNLDNTRGRGGKCFMPYLTAALPDLDTTVDLIRRFDAAGCEAIEIGFPFSDSIADGPVIQESFYKALEGGFRVADLFDAIAKIRSEVSAGLVAMVSMSIVRRFGVDAFARRAADSGFDAMIVPDVPVEECDALARSVESAGLCNILMSAPTSSEQRKQRVAARAKGFIYVIAARGITGERSSVADDLAANVAQLRAATGVPLIVGFGVGTREQVQEVCRSADGVIVGSAIVRRINDCIEKGASRTDLVETLGRYVDDLKAGAIA